MKAFICFYGCSLGDSTMLSFQELRLVPAIKSRRCVSDFTGSQIRSRKTHGEDWGHMGKTRQRKVLIFAYVNFSLRLVSKVTMFTEQTALKRHNTTAQMSKPQADIQITSRHGSRSWWQRYLVHHRAPHPFAQDISLISHEHALTQSTRYHLATRTLSERSWKVLHTLEPRVKDKWLFGKWKWCDVPSSPQHHASRIMLQNDRGSQPNPGVLSWRENFLWWHMLHENISNC